jgi:hypothetical protein
MGPSLMRARLACALACVVIACGEPPRPRLLGLEIWEGQLSSNGLPMLGRRIAQEANGSFTLRRETQHIARLNFRTSGRADRCLFRPFFYSWDLPSHSYVCYPEEKDGAMTLDLPFATWTRDIARSSDPYLGVQTYEHGPDRNLIGVWDQQRYAVRFID